MKDVLLTGMATASAATYPQPALPTYITQVTNQINFAPTAPATKLILRGWERQPSTAFLPRHKSRKIWKRFRRSMEALRGRRIVAPLPSRIEESEFAKEINQSANAEYIRAVKRRRLQPVLHDNNQQDADAQAPTERGRSFLETKWELEIGKRKRKMVTLPQDSEAEGQLVVAGHDAENEADDSHCAKSLEENPHAVVLCTAPEVDENGASEDDDADHGAVISEIVDLALEAPGNEGQAAAVREFIVKQEPTLVRSALRMNSLDGEDAALLTEFLSRAQAKRAANAAMVPNESKIVTRKNDKNRGEERPQVEVTLSSPARRVLEELDVNSPSIQKQVVSTPTKAEKLPESPSASEPSEDQISSPTPACRRSTRTKPSRTHQTRNLRPAVPNQIPVRRANGTEFVFLQRTEAQELALTTRKNTRRNKGNAVLPKYVLRALGKQEQDDKTQVFLETEEKDSSQQNRQSPRKHAKSRQVLWRDEKLVEYAPEKIYQTLDSPSPGKKKSRRDGSKSKQETTTTTTTPALPATPIKKVRKINMAAMSSSNRDNTTDSDSAAISTQPLAAGTPIPKRKKLTPRVPRGSTTSTATTTASTTELSLSHRPSKNAPHPSSGTTATANKLSSSMSGSQHAAQKASSIPRSRSLVKASGSSSAGATPIVKRVRARRAAV